MAVSVSLEVLMSRVSGGEMIWEMEKEWPD
jgi:hypothetical protein